MNFQPIHPLDQNSFYLTNLYMIVNGPLKPINRGSLAGLLNLPYTIYMG